MPLKQGTETPKIVLILGLSNPIKKMPLKQGTETYLSLLHLLPHCIKKMPLKQGTETVAAYCIAKQTLV